MDIPYRNRGAWAAQLVKDCTVSRSERVQRGTAFRNVFLTGSEDGTPQTFLRTQDFIQDVRAMLYSAAELRFSIDYSGHTSPAERAKAHAAASALTERFVNFDIDDCISDIVLWSLIKGKALQKIIWSRGGAESYLIQPEAFGVYNESINSLDRQEAFVHTTYETRSRFQQMISRLPPERRVALMKAATSLETRSRASEDSGAQGLKQLIVGGMYPYQVGGQPAASTQGQGTVTHLFAPQPTMRAEQLASLVPIDELWVWNNQQDDWATITIVGEEVIFGQDELYNAFARDYLTQTRMEDDTNPLKGRHPFIEYCGLPLDGYFWGVSYVFLVSLLQYSLNRRIDGINTMLRKQEDPPRFISGTTSINQNAYAKLNKAGGYFTDGSPSAKIQDITKDVPPDIWRSFHELNGMFDIVGGFPPIMQGEGQGSVRSQGQSDALMRTGAARHLDAALKIERSVQRCGSLVYDLLRAKDTSMLTAWVMPSVHSMQLDDPETAIGLEPPAPGMKPISFRFFDLAEHAKVSVDSHSASPAFRHEARQLAFALAKAGAVSPKRLVEMTHPPMEDVIIEDIERAEIEKAQFMAQHPELVAQMAHKKH
jgi:hypothetical protein